MVCLVDDDESVRESLPDLLKELGFAARRIRRQKRSSIPILSMKPNA